MELGLLLNPGHRPGSDLSAAVAWDVELIRWADELGYREAWIGEHLTVPWEPVPAPDLVIAQALTQTSTIRLGPSSLNLPLHHPAMVAHRWAFLDQLSQGRINLGLGASGTLTDWHLYGIDGASGQHREMMVESLDAVVRLWTEPGPYESSGRFWTVNKPGPMVDGFLDFHMQPFQRPHPPIHLSGLSPQSPTLRLCGERGYAPLSLALNTEYLAELWRTVEQGADTTGAVVDRSSWGIGWDVFVAETDEEALRLSLDSGMGAYLGEFWLPMLRGVGLASMYKADPDMSDADLTPEYYLRHCALVGSVETVVDKIEESVARTGGFGTLIQQGHDFADDRAPLRASMEMLATEVMPRVRAARGVAEGVSR
ncbi:LLM class flavin-dependent oxidoreductase [Gordonia sp. zg691]|uniref:LLM class flavin-dependent oxidoreductase n=1 Tax=Gordonia jinghuaiqii TaxID=2758710 RepID=A0A7D7LR78_9ACTN|nr:LLM class flavin-dependent oxidoreductase [Gordonia jinghuaiqii]MBD0860479.1 LLM class flavin-dependent oxidoreductase [Gordonia jinghuaiqii]MCR5978252.1 LLM class flavin-dependent oxidoreductase [Gordonia jinghuaiqii]QMT01300.1 LLM class flavin-dependent oxidoreductase [Gordonia jinghuaiqii]